MIVQHNIMAINSHRQLGINNSNLSKNLEKLSSGYRINRAADDAAGLAISEKMRAQITGIDRAVLNAQDGASLIQTAEGALAEVHSMLNRMVELATQSANGTIQADDRQKIESELTALKDEIDRISQATNFNGIQLLDGSLSTGGANAAVRGIELGNLKFSEVAAANGSYTTTVALTTTVATAAGDVGKYLATRIEMEDGSSFNFDFEIVLKTGYTDKYALRSSTGEETDFDLATGVTAADYANALEKELDKHDFISENFFITKNAANGFDFQAKKAGLEAPKIKGVSTTIDHEAKADLGDVTLYTSITVADGPTIAADAYKTSVSDNFKLATYNDTKENMQKAIFEVNGQKFAYVDLRALDSNTVMTTEQKAEARAKFMETLGDDVNVVEITSGAGVNTPTAADATKMAKLVSDKTGLDVRGTAAAGLDFRMPAYGDKVGAGGLTMQVGDTAADYNKITVSVEDMSSKGLGIANISMATQEAADKALDKVKAAIEKVSENRGNLGALQNRLEHTINNLNVTSENMTAAESRIRDVDMAKEMMAFTKNNVLAQAAQAMLAQANMQPQQVLQLLR